MGRTLFSVDVGGTFTDVVMVRDGDIHVTKVPSNAAATHLPVIEGARRLGVRDAAVFNHASTKGLNAVLTRCLPKVGFLTTQGHRDMLDAGRCMRPMDNQTDARWHRPFGDAARPLVRRYLRRGIHERILATGEVLIELDESQARAELEILKRCGIQGLAICLINSYRESGARATAVGAGQRSLRREVSGVGLLPGRSARQGICARLHHRHRCDDETHLR